MDMTYDVWTYCFSFLVAMDTKFYSRIVKMIYAESVLDSW